jgi:hypothetical protein
VAQALGHFRLVAIIVTGNLKTQFGVHSKSLGQVACSHVLGGRIIFGEITFIAHNNTEYLCNYKAVF